MDFEKDVKTEKQFERALITAAEEVGLWQDRIKIAKNDQEQWADQSGAKRFIKEYQGDYQIVFHARKRTIPVPPINEVFSYVQTDLATMYNRDPYLTVNPRAGTPKGAALWELLLNYYWRELKIKEEMEREILEKDLVGFGWHKVGYAVDAVKTGDTLKIENETLYSQYVDWKDIVWNVGAKRPPDDCLWMAHRIVRPLREIKRKFPAAKGLEGVPIPEIDKETYKKSTFKDDIKVGVIWEIWDAQEKKILLIAEGVNNKYLQPKKNWPDYLDEFPFLMYWDFLVPGQSRPMSAIASWEPQILEEMILLASAINHAKRWNRQAFVKNGTIDENSLDKYERGDDGAIIVYNGETADIKLADFGQLPTDFYLLMDRLQAIKRNINGQPDFVRGGVTKTGSRTMGELNLMQVGNRTRQDRKIDRLETHLENIARHMMVHLKANFDLEQTVKITGESPEELIDQLGENYDSVNRTVKFTSEEIKGEYDIEVKAGSTLPMDKQTRIQVLQIVLQTLGQLTPEMTLNPFLNTIIQELLKDFDIKKLQEAYEEMTAQAQEKAMVDQGEKDVDQLKTRMEAAKREAQARDITLDMVIKEQEMMLGPEGRARMERLKKPEPRSPANVR